MQANKASLSMMNIQGKVDRPIMSGNGYRVGYGGYGRIPMATGGIIYNHKIGDLCMGIVGDHVEPGVSLKNPIEKESNVLQAFACTGNRAKVTSGDAKGEEGYVTGKHGGIDHVMVYFDEETPEPMTVEDKALIRACGQGLELMDYEEIQLMNVDSVLSEGLGIVEEEQGTKTSAVTRVPAYPMGGGLGGAAAVLGDYDIMTQDAQANRESGTNGLHLGDLVMIRDHDNHNGPCYRRGAVSVSIVVYADFYTNGRDPGLAVIISSRCGGIEPILNSNTNIVNYLHTE